MTIEFLQALLGWCLLLNVGLLLGWVLFFWLAHDFVYRVHGKMFKLSVETFDAIHYGGMAIFKIGIFLFNLIPYLALLIIQ